jgi:creatinine amidohydrolase/Fe(II)-dependent formamide hydrolase-like protein
MTRIILAALAIVVAAAPALDAQDPAAGRAGRGGRGQSDPRDAGGGQCASNPWNCMDAVNPIPARNTVWMEEMTWMDVRDAIRAGKTTVIVATGGMEPNGPWLVTGKHNYVVHANCEAIARKLGNALCAPIVKFVPEGSIDPPTGHMRSPGTISMREETFRALLTDIVASLKMHGFKQIFLIGDSGGNQAGQRAVADSLNRLWNADPLVAHVQEYYTYAVVADYMATHGLRDVCREQLHDDPVITLNMFIDDPRSIKYDERVQTGRAKINGIDISDRAIATDLARKIVDFRAQYTVDAMQKAVANRGTLPAPQPQRGGGRGAGGAAEAVAAPALPVCSYTGK